MSHLSHLVAAQPRADGLQQTAVIGNQVAGRVGFFLDVDDFDAAYERMRAAGVEFTGSPRTEPYGRVAVFLDIAGNKWDLIGPASPVSRKSAAMIRDGASLPARDGP